MSAPTLAEAVAQYGRDAYLLTIANDGPHTSFVSVDLKGNVIACAIGKSAARNIASKPNVSLFWPPREPGGYALVVNGTATGRRELGGVTRAEITLTNQSFIARARSLPTATGHAHQTAGASQGQHKHAVDRVVHRPAAADQIGSAPATIGDRV